MLVVEFDPSDAVSVPTDCDFQKLRVSKYKVISDITDTRKELNKPVYEANKPIYGSDDDFVDEGEWDDDNDYVDMESNIDDGSGLEYDLDDDHDMDSTEKDVHDSINNYITNKHDDGLNPTLKHIADLRICKNEGLTCKQIANIVEELGFTIEDNDESPFYLLRVY